MCFFVRDSLVKNKQHYKFGNSVLCNIGHSYHTSVKNYSQEQNYPSCRMGKRFFGLLANLRKIAKYIRHIECKTLGVSQNSSQSLVRMRRCVPRVL